MNIPNSPSGSASVARSFVDLSPAAHAIWAKSGDAEVTPPTNGHGLLAHMLDVAAVTEAVLALEAPQTLTWAANAFGVPAPSAARWLATMVGLHDIGKAIPGFQAKWEAGRNADHLAGLQFRPADAEKSLHDLASAHELQHLLLDLVGSPGRTKAVAGAVAAHHGYVFDTAVVRDARRPGEHPSWTLARSDIFAAYVSTLAPQPSHSDSEIPLPALAWLAGLTSLSDWIGSNTDWFLPCERAVSLVGHHAAALTLARRALADIGWPKHTLLLDEAADTDALVSRIIGRPTATGRPLQAAADRLLAQAQGPQLLIVEAPMGEGKTELAFLAHLRLQAALGHRGLFIGLPTQATGNAMFERTLTFLRAFGCEAGLDIQLAHGGVQVLAPDSLVQLRGIHGQRHDDVRSSAWFSQRRRPLLSPYGVGTLDQALLATLNVKHHFVRLWGLANRVVVLDEVHAYDTYTSGLIEALLRWLQALGCSVVLMSATLPRAKRNTLLRAWGGDAADVPELPYPRVLAVGTDGVRGEHFASRPQGTIELRAVDEDLASIAAAAEAHARQGGCGAVIVNTVQRAQELHGLLTERLAGVLQPTLFHARYPADERQQHEAAVRATFGPAAARPAAALLVATQVVEQSLDIDFDWLISDLAPVDLLLQRAGRLHRHERPRPVAHAEPRLTVAGLNADRLPDLKTTRWGLYSEYLLYRTWAFVSREAQWQLPQDIDRLVQTVYGDDELPEGLTEASVNEIDIRRRGEHLAESSKERLLARKAAVDARDAFQDAYAGRPQGNDEGDFPGVRNVTRLGPDSLTVVPVHTDGGAWRLHADGPSFDPTQPLDADLARAIVQRQLRLARHDVVKALRDTEPPQGFTDHPWLRHLKVLTLTGGACTLGNTRIVLHCDLGLIYEAAASTGSEK